jgi:hypothetical protein
MVMVDNRRCTKTQIPVEQKGRNVSLYICCGIINLETKEKEGQESKTPLNGLVFYPADKILERKRRKGKKESFGLRPGTIKTVYVVAPVYRVFYIPNKLPSLSVGPIRW